MPIVDPSSSAPLPEQPHQPQIATPEYRGVTVDTRYVPQASLLSHVEGSSWTVNYYSQVLDSSSDLAGQNINRSALYQQYTLVQGLELKVTTPLTTSQDNASKSMIVTGGANVYPFIIPNEGDMFIADIGDGKEGVFRVTLSERKSVFKDTVHTIEYQLIDYSTPARRNDLNSKVVKKVYFVRDFLQYGQNPLLFEEDYVIMQKLQERYYDMAQTYFRMFVSQEYKTLIVPGQEQPVYDHFLTSAVMAFFTMYDSPEVRNIRKLNVDDDNVMRIPTIWDVLRTRDKHLLKFCNRQAGLVSAKTFTHDPMMEGIYHSGITYVVYPKDPELDVDSEVASPKPMAEVILRDVPSRVRNLADLLGDKVFEGLTRPDSPPTYRITVDDYYVFSQNFYNNTKVGQSLLEIQVRDYIDGKAPNNKALLALAQTYHAWGALERFYYVPVLLMLIKASVRSI